MMQEYINRDNEICFLCNTGTLFRLAGEETDYTFMPIRDRLPGIVYRPMPRKYYLLVWNLPLVALKYFICSSSGSIYDSIIHKICLRWPSPVFYLHFRFDIVGIRVEKNVLCSLCSQLFGVASVHPSRRHSLPILSSSSGSSVSGYISRVPLSGSLLFYNQFLKNINF